MLIASVATIAPETPPATLPLTLQQTSARSSSTLMLALLVPMAMALLYPFILVAGHLAQNTGIRDALIEHPASILQIVLALAFWIVLLGWPLKRAADALASARIIFIDAETVHVTESTAFGSRSWTEPLKAYRGLVHHVRASLSGIRHELILVHPKRDRSVLVAIAPSFSQSEIDRVAHLLGCAEIPSRELYRVRRSSAGLTASGPETGLTGAPA
jgi:hypothetical protein